VAVEPEGSPRDRDPNDRVTRFIAPSLSTRDEQRFTKIGFFADLPLIPGYSG
jgi:hypothetical protein